MGQLLALLMLQYSRLSYISSNSEQRSECMGDRGSQCTARRSSKEGQRAESTGEQTYHRTAQHYWETRLRFHEETSQTIEGNVQPPVGCGELTLLNTHDEICVVYKCGIRHHSRSSLTPKTIMATHHLMNSLKMANSPGIYLFFTSYIPKGIDIKITVATTKQPL